jgi:hypothetical protein
MNTLALLMVIIILICPLKCVLVVALYINDFDLPIEMCSGGGILYINDFDLPIEMCSGGGIVYQ